MRGRSQAFGFLPHPYNLPTNSVLQTEILIDKYKAESDLNLIFNF